MTKPIPYPTTKPNQKMLLKFWRLHPRSLGFSRLRCSVSSEKNICRFLFIKSCTNTPFFCFPILSFDPRPPSSSSAAGAQWSKLWLSCGGRGFASLVIFSAFLRSLLHSLFGLKQIQGVMGEKAVEEGVGFCALLDAGLLSKAAQCSLGISRGFDGWSLWPSSSRQLAHLGPRRRRCALGLLFSECRVWTPVCVFWCALGTWFWLIGVLSFWRE